jgi:hypothetical protein
MGNGPDSETPIGHNDSIEFDDGARTVAGPRLGGQGYREAAGPRHLSLQAVRQVVATQLTGSLTTHTSGGEGFGTSSTCLQEDIWMTRHNWEYVCR